MKEKETMEEEDTNPNLSFFQKLTIKSADKALFLLYITAKNTKIPSDKKLVT